MSLDRSLSLAKHLYSLLNQKPSLNVNFGCSVLLGQNRQAKMLLRSAMTNCLKRDYDQKPKFLGCFFLPTEIEEITPRLFVPSFYHPLIFIFKKSYQGEGGRVDHNEKQFQKIDVTNGSQLRDQICQLFCLSASAKSIHRGLKEIMLTLFCFLSRCDNRLQMRMNVHIADMNLEPPPLRVKQNYMAQTNKKSARRIQVKFRS